MKPHYLISSLLLLFTLQASSAFPHFFTNITHNHPNFTFPNTTQWDAFRNFSGCGLGETRDGLAQIKQYFHQFGYLPDPSSNYTDDFDDMLESALKTYQQNFNLNETGILDDITLGKITLPRCGVADVINGTSTMKSGTGMKYSVSGKINSVGHYSFFPSRPKWPAGKQDLTYAFEPGNQLTDSVKSVFRSAFAKWAEVTTLTFTETGVYSGADIRIGFYTGDHGDGEGFDGVLGTLAHAFSPPDGRFHLDEAENWVVTGDVATSSMSGAIDLESVAVHEIGHLLGMGHSSVEEAIMFPTITTGSKKVDLTNDDIQGIQVLYGANPNFSGADPAQDPSNQERGNSGGVHSWANFKWAMGMVVGVALLML